MEQVSRPVLRPRPEHNNSHQHHGGREQETSLHTGKTQRQEDEDLHMPTFSSSSPSQHET